jgi:uncharacterized protein (TIGR02246 family)
MRKIPICLTLLTALVYGAGDAAGEVRAVLETQQALWNRGDTTGFTAYYTEDTAFVSTQVLRGRAQVLERYQKLYPNRDAMGKLTFSDLEITMLGKDYASVIGKWRLDRGEKGGGDVGGYYTLLLKRTKQGWRIILDHTS